MGLEVVIADNERQRRDAFRLRHRVFVEEMGYEIPGLDPERGLVDPEDETAVILVAYDGPRAVGSLTIDWWADTDLRPEVIQNLRLDAFGPGLPRDAVVIVRKLSVLGSSRARGVTDALVGQAIRLLLRPGIHFAFIDCSPYLVRYYERLGFRQYAPHFGYDGILSVPMCCVLTDRAHLSACRSPLLRLMQESGLDPHGDAKCGCQVAWPEVGSGSSKSDSEPLAAIPELPTEPPSFDVRGARLFDGFDEEEAARVLEHRERVSFEPKTVFIRPDDDRCDLVIPTRGFAEIVLDRTSGVSAVSTVGPGDLLGELRLLLGSEVGASVVALGKLEGIRLPSRALERQPSGIKAKLFRNLGAILADRLRVSYRFVNRRLPL
jgi:predicted N-acetyltransferase YhbS